MGFNAAMLKHRTGLRVQWFRVEGLGFRVEFRVYKCGRKVGMIKSDLGG